MFYQYTNLTFLQEILVRFLKLGYRYTHTDAYKYGETDTEQKVNKYTRCV